MSYDQQLADALRENQRLVHYAVLSTDALAVAILMSDYGDRCHAGGPNAHVHTPPEFVEWARKRMGDKYDPTCCAPITEAITALSKNTLNPVQGTAAQGEGRLSPNGAVVEVPDPSPDRTPFEYWTPGDYYKVVDGRPVHCSDDDAEYIYNGPLGGTPGLSNYGVVEKSLPGVGNTEPKPFSWLCKCGGELSTTLDVCCFCWRDRAASEVLPQANPHPNCGQYPNCGCGPTGKCAAAFTSQGNPA
jgi:hypothetical protein